MRKTKSKRSVTKQTKGTKKSLRRKLIYTAVSIALVFMACEIGLRVRAWARYGTAAPNVPDELVVYSEQLGIRVPRPGAKRMGSKIHIEINSLGFRGEEFSPEKPPGTIRIACVGASTTFCAEVSGNDATWPARLEHLLRGRFPNTEIQVINAGVGGYTIADSLKNLEHRVLPLDPDLVIFYQANNDMAIDTRDVARERGIIKKDESFRSPFSKFLSERSLFYDLATKNLAVLFSRGDSQTEKLTDLPSDLPDRFIGRLGEMHDMLAERDIPLVLSSFLTKYRRDQPRETQIANADVAFYYMPWMTVDSLVDGMDLYNEAIIEFAHKRQIPIIEERESVPGDAVHFADFAHFTDAGCEAVARRFAQVIEDEQFLTITENNGNSAP